MSSLKQTPLYPVYKEHGAKTIDFGGWDLPVQFTGILEEHRAVREKAGLFDVSHMGEVDITGPDALAFIQKITTNDASKLVPNKAQYAIMCYPDGGTVDDLLVYKFADDHYLLVINASNIEKDVKWMEQHVSGNMALKNISEEVAELALQGPLSETILQKLTKTDLSQIAYFHFLPEVDLDGITALVSRTGYTGEDGFELYVKPDDAQALWKKIIEAGVEDIIPCGLGARDTLRYEVRMPLYGQELSQTISPVEAGLTFAIKLDKGDFIGREALKEQMEKGAPRKLVGLEMVGRGIARTHYPVYAGEEMIGEVTTGTQSPTLKKNMALALVKADFAAIGQEVDVEIRNKRVKAVVVATPFYKRAKK